MRNIYLPIFLIAMVLTAMTGCQKSLTLRTADKTVGTWKFEKVKANRILSFKSDDITSDYEGVTLEFKSDYSVVESDASGERNGIWQIEPYTYSDGDADASGFRLVGALHDSTGAELSLISWDNFCVNRNRITCTSTDGETNFRYKLVRM